MKRLTFDKEKDNKAEPLAIVRGGRKNNEVIYFTEALGQSELKVENLLDHVSEKTIRSKKKYMSLRDIMKVKRAFENNQVDADINDIFEALKDEVSDSVNKHIHIEDGVLDPIPILKEGQVDHVMISGMNGVGKSTWIAGYCRQYKKLFPKNHIYLFSRKDHDDAFEDIEMKQFKLDENILDVDYEISDLKNSLCIFDDIDTMAKEVSAKVQKIRDDLLECGRSYGIYMCNVSHQILNYTKTRNLILESNKIIFFPRSSQYQIKRFLMEYIGLDRAKVKFLMGINSRWICINKSYPITVISEHDIYIL